MTTGILRVGPLMVAVAILVTVSPVGARLIHRREARQKARIAAGVTTGKLSPAEAGRLEQQEAAVEHEEKAMRAANGGRLSLPERRVLTRQQNRLSRRIYRQKHDGNNQ